MREKATRTSTSADLDLDRHLAHLVYSLVDTWDKQVADSASRAGLTSRQSVVIYELGEPRRMADLAVSMNCNPSNITAIVDRLEARGLVTRTPDAHDRRATTLSLTVAGEARRTLLQAHIYDRRVPFGRLTTNDKRALRELIERALDDG